MKGYRRVSTGGRGYKRAPHVSRETSVAEPARRLRADSGSDQGKQGGTASDPDSQDRHGLHLIPQQKDMFTRRFRTVKTDESELRSLHIPLVSMLRWAIKPDVIYRHCPNGEHRDPRTAAKLKAMGVLAGSADLEFFWNDGQLRMMFLELKLPGRKCTDVQNAFACSVRRIGAAYHVATTIDDALNLIGECGLFKANVTVGGRRW